MSTNRMRTINRHIWNIASEPAPRFANSFSIAIRIRQLCCRGMCKYLLRSDGQRQNDCEAKLFPVNKLHQLLFLLPCHLLKFDLPSRLHLKFVDRNFKSPCDHVHNHAHVIPTPIGEWGLDIKTTSNNNPSFSTAATTKQYHKQIKHHSNKASVPVNTSCFTILLTYVKY